MSNCGCEGSCPVCRMGEVDDHQCGNCGIKFCPKCHGILPPHASPFCPVEACSCASRPTGVPTAVVTALRVTGNGLVPPPGSVEKVDVPREERRFVYWGSRAVEETLEEASRLLVVAQKAAVEMSRVRECLPSSLSDLARGKDAFYRLNDEIRELIFSRKRSDKKVRGL